MGMFIVDSMVCVCVQCLMNWVHKRLSQTPISTIHCDSFHFVPFESIDSELWANRSLLLLHSLIFFIFKSFIVSIVILSVHKRSFRNELQALQIWLGYFCSKFIGNEFVWRVPVWKLVSIGVIHNGKCSIALHKYVRSCDVDILDNSLFLSHTNTFSGEQCAEIVDRLDIISFVSTLNSEFILFEIDARVSILITPTFFLSVFFFSLMKMCLIIRIDFNFHRKITD